jgi:hypothetical protein
MDLRMLPSLVVVSIVIATPCAEQLTAHESPHIDLIEVNQPIAHSPPAAVISRAILKADLSARAGLSGTLS